MPSGYPSLQRVVQVMARLRQGEKRVQLSFIRPEDVALFERLEKMAYDRRYDLSVFLVIALHEAFADTDAEDRRASLESKSNKELAADTPQTPSRTMIAALVRQQLQTPSDPPE